MHSCQWWVELPIRTLAAESLAVSQDKVPSTALTVSYPVLSAVRAAPSETVIVPLP